MPSILFGETADPRRIDRGSFFCPDCAADRRFERVVVHRAVAVLGIRMPAGRYGEYVECGDCLATYRPEVLAYDAGAETPQVMPEYQRAMRRVLALLVITDGRIHDAEVATVRRIFEAVSGARLTAEDVLAEARAVAAEPVTAARYLARVVGYLNDYGCEQVLRAAALVSRADGVVHRLEAEMVRRLGAVMRIDVARVDAILAEAGPDDAAPGDAGPDGSSG